MFSEYASRFLAQSQSRLLNSQTDVNSPRNPLERRPGGLRASQRGFQRQSYGNPYQAQASRFPFASRLQQNQAAPLFYSATDEFREEEDTEEHDREVADYYALQRSRRDFGSPAFLGGSTDLDEQQRNQGASRRWQRPNQGSRVQTRPRGLQSSWTQDDAEESNERQDRAPSAASVMSNGDSNVAGRLVDVELASTIHEADEFLEERRTRHTDKDQDDDDDDDGGEPSIQYLHRNHAQQPLLQASKSALYNPEPGAESIAPVVAPASEPPRHDSFFASLYLISIAAVFATFVIVCLHTSAPGKNSKLGDTVYTALHACFYLFAWDTVISIFVALVWLATLRAFAKPLVLTLIVAVPIILFSFTLYPFISSMGGSWEGSSVQDRVMRWASIIPALGTIFWVYTVYQGRRSLGRAIEILEFSTRILAACPALVPLGFATLAIVVSWTWLWMLMFTRVFLGGHLSNAKSPSRFILDASTWWQAVFFVLMYLWTLGVISGVQRATTAATVSQWYFHRLIVPAPSSQRVVRASLIHAVTTIFGTICFSTLAALAVRLPLLVLPRRISSWMAFVFYSFVPASVATLTNPLTLTYSAIHSQPLTMSARGLSELVAIGPASTTSTLTPRSFKAARNFSAPADNGSNPSLVAFRLAKLLLHATRMIASLAFGIGGWVTTARLLQVEKAGYRGSLYAYVVGLIAGAIGWAVMGAMEGVLGGILDAVLVCWGSEIGAGNAGTQGAARYCREAGELLAGGEEQGPADEERGFTGGGLGYAR